MFTDIVGVTIVGVTMDKSRNSVFLLGGSLEQVSLTDSACSQYFNKNTLHNRVHADPSFHIDTRPKFTPYRKDTDAVVS